MSVRPLRHASVAALAALPMGVALLVGPGAAASGITLPVNCTEQTTLDRDGATYELYGTCGHVVVTADQAQVTMPTAVSLTLTGSGTTVTAKSIREVTVSGADSVLTAPSIAFLDVSGAFASVSVAGLLEHGSVTGSGATVEAQRFHDVVVRGDGAQVRMGRGYAARIEADGVLLSLRRLERLVVDGDHNRARVEAGSTRIRVRGSDNRVRVAQRA